jgi:hypothetical protein
MWKKSFGHARLNLVDLSRCGGGETPPAVVKISYILGESLEYSKILTFLVMKSAFNKSTVVPNAVYLIFLLRSTKSLVMV